MLLLQPAQAANVARVGCEQWFQQCLISPSVTSCHVEQDGKLAVKCTCSCPSHLHYIKPGANLWSYLRVVCLIAHPFGCFVVCCCLFFFKHESLTIFEDQGCFLVIRGTGSLSPFMAETKMPQNSYPGWNVIEQLRLSFLAFCCCFGQPKSAVLCLSQQTGTRDLSEVPCCPRRSGLIFLVGFPVTELGAQHVEESHS